MMGYLTVTPSVVEGSLPAVIARSDSDEAIQKATGMKTGLLRFARNDEEGL